VRVVNRRVVLITELIAPYRIPVFNALARQPGIDLHVIFLSRTDSTTRAWRVYEDEITFSYEVLSSWRKRLGKYNLLLNRGIDHSLDLLRPHVIVCGGYNYLASWQALRWARSHRVPFVLWCESTAQDHRSCHLPVERLKRLFFSRCDSFLVPGESSYRYVQQFGIHPDNIFIARNAVDLELFARSGDLARHCAEQLRQQLGLPARYFLFVGRLIREKGVFDLLDAYRRLLPSLRTNIGLVFAGDGPLRSDLETAARDIHPGEVHLSGFVQRDELAHYYALAECLVFPTRTDPWGLVVNEAMACGLPVICSDVAGCARDLIRNNGRLFQAGNIGELSSAMRQLATDPQLRRAMSQQSRTLIADYSPEACAYGIAHAASCQEIYV
jgi:glycosyltransferase involved in cell wall biosynthesis